VLLLNAHYAALRVVNARRAFVLLCKRDHTRRPVAEVVAVESGRYISYDLTDWIELSALKHQYEPHAHEWVRTPRFPLALPRIIRVLRFHRVPRQEVKFNRRNLLARDDNTCQYCGRRFPAHHLTLDHIVPRSQGGDNSWENIVCACHRCNVRKGGRTPTQAHLHLIREPAKPHRNPVLNITLADHRYSSWRPFFESAHWDVEPA
jgi:5-methylcytosine-specific restriction endonuclease McrA